MKAAAVGLNAALEIKLFHWQRHSTGQVRPAGHRPGQMDQSCAKPVNDMGGEIGREIFRLIFIFFTL